MIAALSSLELPAFAWGGIEARVSSIDRFEVNLLQGRTAVYGRCQLFENDEEVAPFGLVTFKQAFTGVFGASAIEVYGLEIAPIPSGGYEVQFVVENAALDAWIVASNEEE